MALHPAQLDPFSLAGGGAVAGATSFTLKSFKTIDGVALTMADFGAIGYGTLEPGNGNLEEQISFTGVVQNASGTATLTGVSSVLFLTPYTESSGLSKTHAGSTAFVISNTSGYYNQIPFKQNNEVISGQWEFLNTPITPPAVSFASTTVAGVVQEGTQAQVDAGTAYGDTGGRLYVNPSTQRSRLQSDYVEDTGAADAYVITPDPAITAYVVGQQFSFKAANANTGASTLAVNGLTAKDIKDSLSTLVEGDILAGQIVQVEYDGTAFQMVSSHSTPVPTKLVFTNSGTWTKPARLQYVEVELVGGGGGSGGTTTAGDATGGGGGGGYSRKRILAADLGATETVTVGAAGAAGVNSGGDGGTGGTSSFGSHLSATGGTGGANTVPYTGGGGGLGSNGDVNSAGQGGGNGCIAPNSIISGGLGGSSLLGGGGRGASGDASGNGVGVVGGNYGGGGGGSQSGSGADTLGAAGAKGIVICYEYYN